MKKLLACALALILCLSVTALADVAKGSKGDEVKRIQQRLVDLGYLTGKVDGSFGGMTESAVKAFQKSVGLEATGVVDDVTNGVLFDSRIKPSLFAGAFLWKWHGCGDSTGAGENDKGQMVDYCLQIVVPTEQQRFGYQDEMLYSASWTDTILDASYDASLMPVWNNCHQGKTSGYYSAGEFSDDNFNNVVGCAVIIYLPDDPGIAGRQYIELESEGDKAIVYFTLEYKGNYSTGIGWKVSDVSVECVPSEATKAIVAEYVHAANNDAFKDFQYDSFPFIYTYDTSDPLYYVGRNGKGQEITCGIFLCNNAPIGPMQVTSLSWSNSFQPVGEYASAWNLLCGGTTLEEEWYDERKQSDGSLYKNASAWLYLPDDPSIAGEQTITLVSEDQQLTLRINLKYLGSYQDGRGWDVTFLDATKEPLGTAHASTAAAPVAQTQTTGNSAAAESLQNTSVEGGCGWTDNPDDTTFYVGRNSTGNHITYGVTVTCPVPPERIKLIALSWTNDYKYNMGYRLTAWEHAKDGETEYMQSDNQLDIFLPDDPALEGEQWMMITCQDQRALVRFKLTYLGGYRTGYGWQVEYLDTTVNQIN